MKDHEKQQQTALLAYQFWMERGCPVGSPAEDWFRAERALHSRQLEEVVDDAAEEAPAYIAADTPDGAPGSTLAVAVSSR
jgi:Protein of unknown function (DUF2934)